MGNSQNRNQGQKAQAPQQPNRNPQRFTASDRESNVPNSVSGSERVNQVDVEIGRRLDHQDADNTNTVPNPAERIADPENTGDANFQSAVNKAEDRNLQGTSRKANQEDE